MGGLARAAMQGWASRHPGTVFGAEILMGALLAAFILLTVPILIVAAVGVTWAWSVGWPWSRLRNLAIGALILPLTAIIQDRDLTAPARWYLEAVAKAAYGGQWATALADTIPVSVPLGLAAGWLYWARYQHRSDTGEARSLLGAERHRGRRWTRRYAAARRLALYPTPLTTKKGDLVLGPLVEQTGGIPRGTLSRIITRHPRWLTVPFEATRRHMTIQADTGAGKTVTLIRISAAWCEAAWRLHRERQIGRPLLIFVNAKGGPEALADGLVWCEAMRALGVPPDRVGLWPYRDRLDMWHMSPRNLQETLHSLAATDHHYYAELQRALLHLVVDAPEPEGPPQSSTDFMRRLSPRWLKGTWRDYPTEQASVQALTQGREPALPTNLLLYGNVFRDLGQDMDAGRPLLDFDALYCVIPGTRRPEEARGRAGALMQLLTDAIANESRTGERREVLLAFDEFSAVSALPLWQQAERFRSLACGVIACGQSWPSFGATDDERHRLVDASSGGRLQMRSPDPEEMAQKAGTMRHVEVSRHIMPGPTFAEGSARVQDTYVVAPQVIREMSPGDIVYHAEGRAWWGRVVPLPAPIRPHRSAVISETALRRPAVTRGERIPVGELEAALTHESIERLIRGWAR